MAETLTRSVAERRFTMLVLGLLGAVALVLAAVGVHGVLSYAVAQRTREIGIRMALGAQPSGVLRLIVGEGLALAAAGAALGTLAAFGLARWMGSLLFGVSPTDPLTFVAVPAVLTLVCADGQLPAGAAGDTRRSRLGAASGAVVAGLQAWKPAVIIRP